MVQHSQRCRLGWLFAVTASCVVGLAAASQGASGSTSGGDGADRFIMARIDLFSPSSMNPAPARFEILAQRQRGPFHPPGFERSPPEPAAVEAGSEKPAKSLPTPPDEATETAEPGREEWIVILTLKRETLSNDLSVHVENNLVFLPLGFIADAVLIPIEKDAQGRMTGTDHLKGRAFTVDPRSGFVTIDGETLPDSRGAAFREGGEVFVRSDLFAPLMDIDVAFDRSASRVALTSPGPLSFEVRRAQERARERQVEQRAAIEGVRDVEIPYEAFTAPVGDIALNAGYGEDGRLSSRYSALFSNEIFYLTSRFIVSGDADDGLRNLSATFGRQDSAGKAFGVQGLTEAWFGDVRGQRVPLVGTVGAGIGVSMSSFPLDRPDAFDLTDIEGDALPGWTVELYQNGQLLDFQIAGDDGRYRFEDVPLLFGKNTFRTVLYGPQGQQREETREFAIGAELTPPGETLYRLAAGQGRRGLFDPLLPNQSQSGFDSRFSAAFEIERGMSHNFTLRGFSTFTPEDTSPEARDTFTLGTEAVMSFGEHRVRASAAVQAHGGVALGGTAFGRFGSWSASAQVALYANFRSTVARDSARPLDFSGRLRAGRSLDAGPRGAVQVSGGAEYFRYAGGGDRLLLEASANHRVGQAFVRHRLDLERRDALVRRRGVKPGDWRAAYTPTVSWSRNSLSLQARARLDLGGRHEMFAQSNVTARYRIDRYSSVSGGATWTPAGRALAFNAGYNRQLEHAIFSLNGGWSPKRQAWIGVGLSFSFGPGSNGMPFVTRQRLADHGGVMTRVFHDMNADGVFDPEMDELLDGVSLTINNRPRRDLVSGEDGAVLHVSGSSRQPVTFGVDARSLPDPFLVPGHTGLRIQPRTGRVVHLDIPVVSSGEVAGTIFRYAADDDVPAAGIEVELHDETERVVGRTRSLSDGFYLIEQIPPGRYWLQLGPDQELTGTKLVITEREVVIGPDGTVLDGIDLELGLPVPEIDGRRNGDSGLAWDEEWNDEWDDLSGEPGSLPRDAIFFPPVDDD